MRLPWLAKIHYLALGPEEYKLYVADKKEIAELDEQIATATDPEREELTKKKNRVIAKIDDRRSYENIFSQEFRKQQEALGKDWKAKLMAPDVAPIIREKLQAVMNAPKGPERAQAICDFMTEAAAQAGMPAKRYIIGPPMAEDASTGYDDEGAEIIVRINPESVNLQNDIRAVARILFHENGHAWEHRAVYGVNPPGGPEEKDPNCTFPTARDEGAMVRGKMMYISNEIDNESYNQATAERHSQNFEPFGHSLFDDLEGAAGGKPATGANRSGTPPRRKR